MSRGRPRRSSESRWPEAPCQARTAEKVAPSKESLGQEVHRLCKRCLRRGRLRTRRDRAGAAELDARIDRQRYHDEYLQYIRTPLAPAGPAKLAAFQGRLSTTLSTDYMSHTHIHFQHSPIAKQRNRKAQRCVFPVAVRKHARDTFTSQTRGKRTRGAHGKEGKPDRGIRICFRRTESQARAVSAWETRR